MAIAKKMNGNLSLSCFQTCSAVVDGTRQPESNDCYKCISIVSASKQSLLPVAVDGKEPIAFCEKNFLRLGIAQSLPHECLLQSQNERDDAE